MWSEQDYKFTSASTNGLTWEEQKSKELSIKKVKRSLTGEKRQERKDEGGQR